MGGFLKEGCWGGAVKEVSNLRGGLYRGVYENNGVLGGRGGLHENTGVLGGRGGFH